MAIKKDDQYGGAKFGKLLGVGAGFLSGGAAAPAFLGGSTAAKIGSAVLSAGDSPLSRALNLYNTGAGVAEKLAPSAPQGIDQMSDQNPLFRRYMAKKQLIG